MGVTRAHWKVGHLRPSWVTCAHRRRVTYFHRWWVVVTDARDFHVYFWGLGQGDLGFRGGAWGLPFRCWGAGTKGTWGLGVGLGDYPLGSLLCSLLYWSSLYFFLFSLVCIVKLYNAHTSDPASMGTSDPISTGTSDPAPGGLRWPVIILGAHQPETKQQNYVQTSFWELSVQAMSNWKTFKELWK